MAWLLRTGYGWSGEGGGGGGFDVRWRGDMSRRPRGDGAEQIPEWQREELRRLNSLDQSLYEYGIELFEKQLAAVKAARAPAKQPAG